MPYCQECGAEASETARYCVSCGATLGKTVREEFSVSAEDMIKKFKELIHDGNVTRIIVKNEEGKTLIEIPATVGVIGAILAPWMAALGVVASLATRCTMTVERRED